MLEVDDPEVDNVGMTTPLLTDSEVAELLRISPRQVLRLARDGALSSIQLSRKETRFDPADVGRFVEFRKRPTE